MEKKEYFCDMCKKQIKDWWSIKPIRLGDRKRDAEVEYDLCDDCMYKVRQFIKGNIKE